MSDQSLASQKSAGKKAFNQVLIKMSGSVDSVNNLALRRAATNYEQLLVSSSFEQTNESLYYLAEFSREGVIELLRSQNLPVWGERRPTTLLWLAIEDDQTKQKRMLSQVNDGEYNSLIQDASYARGVELILPIGDLSDTMNVSANDVWGLYSSTIYNHSIRYGVNYVVGAKVGIGFDDFTASEKVIVEYFITSGKTIETGSVVEDDVPSALAQFVNVYADMLAKNYAVDIDIDGPAKTHFLKVANISSLTQYRSVLSILDSLTITDTVELVSQESDVSVFKIESRVDESQLHSILALENRLIVLDEGRSPDTVTKYMLRGR